MPIGLSVLMFSGLLILLWGGQRRLLYLPSGPVLSPQQGGLSRVDAMTARTSDGLSVAAWFVRSPLNDARGTVIVFNGNAGNRSYRAPLAKGLADAGYSVVLFDYRGFGGNPGRPSEEGLAKDARAVLAAVLARPGVDPKRIVYFGESLGTGVAVKLAAERSPAALVLRSPFTAIADVAAHHYFFLPVRRLLWDRFDVLPQIGHVGAPILIVAGERDRVVPFSLSRQLFDAAPEPKAFVAVPGADHNDADLATGRPLFEAVLPWLERWMK